MPEIDLQDETNKAEIAIEATSRFYEGTFSHLPCPDCGTDLELIEQDDTDSATWECPGCGEMWATPWFYFVRLRKPATEPETEDE